MSYNPPESPLLRRGLPAIGAPMMTIGRERTAIRAMAELRAIGANPLPTHRLPNGMGYVAPDTGRAHGPAESGERWWYGAAEHDGRRNPADIMGPPR